MTNQLSQMTRRNLLRGAATLGGIQALHSAPARSRPNVVVMLADDQGWGDLSIHGNSNLSTPNIDSLGREGALFDRFFACAVCAPTRAEFLTGRYHPRCGVRGVSTGAERMNLDETTIAQTFKQAGYATGAFGKWHNGSQSPYHPNQRGFDEYYGFTSGHWGQYFDAELDHNGSLVRGNGYLTDDLTDHALRFIRQHRQRPFFCYLPYNTPHSPMQVPDRFYERFANLDPKLKNREPGREDIDMTRAALAMCENIDWNAGRVLGEIDKLGLRNDTIVVYFSDNGPNSWRWNGGMKGRKGSLDEGGLRVPMLIRWPGHVAPGRRVGQIAGAIDLRPTLADLAGIPVNGNKPLDGRSLKPLLSGGKPDWPERMIFSMQARRVSVRSQQYRLDASGALYDMIADPGQDIDASARLPDAAARLRKAQQDWSAEMLPMVGPDDRPYTVGYSKTTLLPARDGVNEGGIKRSSIHPNCSFFTNWTSKDDRMTWDIEVGQAGVFDVTVYFTCKQADVGSTVEVSFGDSQVRGKISEANDPPLIGEAQDRAARTESFVKDFRPLQIGSMTLEKRRGKLSLRALEIAGAEVAEIRYLALTRT
jgi:arylsulfatase A-like enzyme